MPQTYLITGATRGIGLEFVRQLAARGENVIATARNVDKARDLVAIGSNVRVMPLDSTFPASIDALGRTLAATPIDVLINNAGVSSTSKSIATLDVEELRHVMMVNSIAPMLVVRALLPSLRAGSHKLVAQITSQLASIANNTGGSTYGYRASKAALNQFNRSLANELRPEGFTCVAVHPGWVRTDMGGPQAHLAPEESVRHMLNTIARLTAADTGSFLNYDGEPLPW